MEAGIVQYIYLWREDCLSDPVSSTNTNIWGSYIKASDMNCCLSSSLRCCTLNVNFLLENPRCLKTLKIADVLTLVPVDWRIIVVANYGPLALLFFLNNAHPSGGTAARVAAVHDFTFHMIFNKLYFSENERESYILGSF